MFELLTGDDLYAEVLLLLDDNKAVILVEGPDDVDSLDSHIDDSGAHLIPGYGKDSVMYAAGLAHQDGIELVLTIVDRDWVGVLDPPSQLPNVLYTDLYDLDATIMNVGGICRRVVSSFCDVTRVRRHLASTGGRDLLSLVVPSCTYVGAVRLHVKEMGIARISVRDFPMSQVMDFDGGTPDLTRILTIASAKSKVKLDDTTFLEIFSAVNAKASAISPSIRHCSGHDLLTSLSALMRKRWGSQVKAEVVMKAIRAAMSCEEFMSTQIFKASYEWAKDRSRSIWLCPELA